MFRPPYANPYAAPYSTPYVSFPQRPPAPLSYPQPMPMPGQRQRSASISVIPGGNYYPTPNVVPQQPPVVIMAPPVRPRPRANTMETQIRSGFVPPARTEPWEWVEDSKRIDKDMKKQQQKAVQKLLGKVDTIRVGVEVARGRGSMSASVSALRELINQVRHAHGRAQFQVVYESGAEQSLMAILGNEGFNSAKTRQRIDVNGKSVLFVREGCLEARDKPNGRMIGFVGADDMPDHPSQRWFNLLGNDTVGNVQAVGIGQPYDWDYGGPPRVLFPKGKNACVPMELHEVRKGYPFHIPNYSPKSLASNLFREAEAMERHPNAWNMINEANEKRTLGTLFDALADGRVEMMPVYGLHHPKMKGKEDELIRNLCGGIKRAQKMPGFSRNPAKPVVVVVIGDYRGSQNKSPELKNFSLASSSDDPTNVVYGNDREARVRIRDARPRGVILLYAGKVPKELFEQVFRLSTLPPVVEGANSANLCLNLPEKPYIHMSLSGTDFPEASKERNGRIHARNVSIRLENNDYEDRYNVRAAVGEYIASSRNPKSDVSKFFAEAVKDFEENNQVTELLYPIAQGLGFGPSLDASPRGVQKVGKSSRSNMTYELWTDGKLYYSRPRQQGKPHEFVLDDLVPALQGQSDFGRDHWIQPCDLRIKSIEFPSLLARRKHLVLHMTGPRNDKYKFEYDETANILNLVEKDGHPPRKPMQYRRLNEQDDRELDGRHDGSARLRKIYNQTPSERENRQFGAPLSRWTSADR